MSDERVKADERNYREAVTLPRIACDGLTLPADVKPGAVKALVEAARAMFDAGTHDEKIVDARPALRAALRNLGIKESPR